MARTSSKKPVKAKSPSAGTSEKARASGKSAAGADDDLWDRVARTITPLPSTTERLSEMARLSEMQAHAERPPARTIPPVTAPVKKAAPRPLQKMMPQTLLTSAPSPARPVQPPAIPGSRDGSAPAQARGRVAGLDRRTAERFRKGTLPIDSRLDLHGLNREQAHAALRLFVRQCHAAGKRCLLVITGKGARGKPDADNPYTTPEPPGRLKREVPGWLANADLAPMILATATAIPRDGGSGALYILLRRRREDRP